MNRILVVTYGLNKLSESTTIQSLVKWKSNLDDKLSLTIWNNGPTPINNDIHISLPIEIIEAQKNTELSKVYNFFIANFPGKKYLILDQDSKFGVELQDNFNSKAHVILPKIIVGDKPIYPRLYPRNLFFLLKKLLPFTLKLNSSNIMSIGSGLMFSHALVLKILKTHDNLFDERFSFYGVDTTFFLRLHKLENVKIEIAQSITHDLSFSKKDLSIWKKQKKSSSVICKLQYYPSFYHLILFFYASTFGVFYNKYDFKILWKKRKN